MFADRAMDSLRGAIREGYKDLARLGADRDLDPLRREDFQLLMMDLVFPADPLMK